MAVNAVRSQIELLEVLFEVHLEIKLDLMSSSQTPETPLSTEEPQTQSPPKLSPSKMKIQSSRKPPQSEMRAHKKVTVDKHTKIWLNFFRECTHPQFLEIKEKIVKPIAEEPEEVRLEKEEERIKNFLSGISATFAYSSGSIHAIKGKYTAARIKTALAKKGVRVKSILAIVDVLYSVNAPQEDENEDE